MQTHGKAAWTAAIVFIALFIAACRGSEVRRSATDRWNVKTFADIGMRMDVPRGAKVDSDPSFGLIVWLHAVRPAALRIAETQYLLTFKAERVPLSEFSERLQSFPQTAPGTPEKQWERWVEERHEKISVLEQGDVSFYRYDAKCAGDEVLRVDVTVRNLVVEGVQKHKAEDDRTVRRMLSSLQCLEPAAPRVSRE